jgi:hypothetical protein
MIHAPDLEERIVVSATGVLAGVVYLGVARRACGGHSAAARYFVGVGSLLVAAAVGLAVLEPIIGYALVCLFMVLAYAVDLVQDERARRRRVASLAPRSRAELLPALWTIVAALSAGMTVPFALAGHQTVAAYIVAACTLIMAATAWRLASAPMQLTGDNPREERVEERASRALRSGISSALAVAIVFVFSSFALKGVTTSLPVEHQILTLSFALWIVIWATTALYVWGIKRSPRGKAA